MVRIEEPEPDGRTLWDFDEAELETLGVGELESGERVPLDALEPARVLHDRVYLRLATEIT